MNEDLTQESINKLLDYLTTVNIEKFKQFELLTPGWFLGFNATDKNMYINVFYNPPELVLCINKDSKTYESNPINCYTNQLADNAKNNLDKLVWKYAIKSKSSQANELGL